MVGELAPAYEEADEQPAIQKTIGHVATAEQCPACPEINPTAAVVPGL